MAKCFVNRINLFTFAVALKMNTDLGKVFGKVMPVFKNLDEIIAEVAQLVEHDLAKVGVAGSSPVFRSRSARMVEW